MTDVLETCPGCGWEEYARAHPGSRHRHDDAEDGPREGCCEHACGRCECPGCPVLWSYHGGLCPWCIEGCAYGRHVPFLES